MYFETPAQRGDSMRQTLPLSFILIICFLIVVTETGHCQAELVGGDTSIVELRGNSSVGPTGTYGFGMGIGVLGRLNLGASYARFPSPFGSKNSTYTGVEGYIECLTIKTKGKVFLSNGVSVIGGGGSDDNGYFGVNLALYLTAPLTRRLSATGGVSDAFIQPNPSGEHFWMTGFGAGFSFNSSNHILLTGRIHFQIAKGHRTTMLSGGIAFLFPKYKSASSGKSDNSPFSN
jgi:hypothetical protein